MRIVAPAALSVLQGPGPVPLALFVEMLLSSPLRLNSSPITIPYAGADWVGAGTLGTVQEIKDGIGERAPLRFELSGVPEDMISLALQESVRNKPCSLYLAVLHPETHAVLDAPLWWSGVLGQMPIEQTPGSAKIAVNAVHAIDAAARLKPFRYTFADQLRAYPITRDTSLRFVLSQAQHQDIWPAASFFRQ